MKLTAIAIHCTAPQCRGRYRWRFPPGVDPLEVFDQLKRHPSCPACDASGVQVQIRACWAGVPDLYPLLFQPKQGTPRKLDWFPLDVASAFHQALHEGAKPIRFAFCYRHAREAAEAANMVTNRFNGGLLARVPVTITDSREMSDLVAQRGAETRTYPMSLSGWGEVRWPQGAREFRA